MSLASLHNMHNDMNACLHRGFPGGGFPGLGLWRADSANGEQTL